MLSKNRYFETHDDLKTTVRYVSPDGYARGGWGKQHRHELTQEYKKEYGNLDIPAKYKTADGSWLSWWVYNQKRLLHSGSEKLNDEQKKKLKELLGYYVKISA